MTIPSAFAVGAACCALLCVSVDGDAAAAGPALQTEPPARAAPPVPRALTIARMFEAPGLSGPALRSMRISPDGRWVTYLKGRDDNKDRLDLWAFDIARRRHLRLVDSTQLVTVERALSAAEEGRRERQRIAALTGIVDYQFSRDSRYLLVPLSGDLYLYDLQAPTARAVKRLTATDSFETDARFSPRGRFVSFVRDQNLFVLELATGRESAMTREGGGLKSFGVAEFIAQEEMDRDTGYWWAPDESRLAFARVDEAPVDEVERFEIYADNVKVIRQRYPAAGRPNADVQLWIAQLPAATSVAGQSAPVRVDLGPSADIYLARVDWFPDSGSLAVQRQSRDQRELSLLRVDVATGAARELLVERSATWVDLHDELTFVPERRQFIWASWRSGTQHLYLYDFEGRLLRPLTSGPWMVTGDGRERAVKGVDAARGRVYFMANRETPLERHLYVAPLDGRSEPTTVASDIRRLTVGQGWHSVSMSRDTRIWLDSVSDPDTPPSLTLRRIDGSAIATLIENRLDGAHPYAPYLAAHRPTNFGILRSSDGQALHFQLTTPARLEPGRRYPVIVDVYGGPGVQRVRRAWGGNDLFFRQILAQSGYIVFTLDNRGSGSRGTLFERALHRRMGTIEVEDQVRGVEYLRTLPYVDPARIGVFGWSYGGYMALQCMLKAPDYFAAGVAGAPVTDWSLYDTHYTERYMETPLGNASGYLDGNVMTHASHLRGPLLLMHGMADDNVLFTHSTALLKRLQDLGKPFDVMPYPGSKHGLLRVPSTGAHAYSTVQRFFDEKLRAPLRTERETRE